MVRSTDAKCIICPYMGSGTVQTPITSVVTPFELAVVRTVYNTAVCRAHFGYCPTRDCATGRWSCRVPRDDHTLHINTLDCRARGRLHESPPLTTHPAQPATATAPPVARTQAQHDQYNTYNTRHAASAILWHASPPRAIIVTAIQAHGVRVVRGTDGRPHPDRLIAYIE